MKRLAALLLVLSATTAMAQHHHHGHWERRGGGWGWVAPVVIGGVIGYELAQPRPPVVVTQQPPVVQQSYCSPWTEIQNPDGTVTITRTCRQ
jgi:hypothetical protein